MKPKQKKHRLDLPTPQHEHGYPMKQLQSFMTDDEFKKFDDWMYGQTMALDSDGGLIAYTEDVQRFLRLIRFGTPTYWD